MDRRPTTEEQVSWGPAGYKAIVLPEKLSSLRQKLYIKAKQEPKFRFYALYDRIYRHDVLASAYRIVRSRKGAGGVDGVTFDQIEASEAGVVGFVEEIRESLRDKRYRPMPVRRVYVPKPDGRLRPLGIPTIRDRVVQMAVLLILEPIFEADFLECSYGFRPQRSAHDALLKVRQYLKEGRTAVYDADLRGYFDSIPHDKLMKCLKMRIVDRSVLRLIRMWLKVPVVRDDGSGGMTVTRSHRGTPQGGVISPLLANIYLHWFEKVFHGINGPGRWAGARIVRYADDFIVLAHNQGRRLTSYIEDKIETWLGLQLNRDKTKIVDLRHKGASIDFLGYAFRYDRDLYGRGHRYLNVEPSHKAEQAHREAIRKIVNSHQSHVPITELIKRVNRNQQGWANYFSFGYPRRVMRSVNWYVLRRLMGHLRHRSQRPFRVPKGVSSYEHLRRLGLVYL